MQRFSKVIFCALKGQGNQLNLFSKSRLPYSSFLCYVPQKNFSEARFKELINEAQEKNKSGRHKEALSDFQEALELCQSLYGQQNPNTSKVYSMIGATLFNCGNYPEAIKNAIRALQTSNNDPKIAIGVYNLIANCYARQGDFVEAHKNLEKKLDIIRKSEKVDEFELAVTYYDLANLFSLQDKIYDAIQYMKRAIALLEQDINVGRNRVKLSEIYTDLSACHKALNEYEEATKCLIRVHDLLINLKGEEQAFVNALENLASIYHEQGIFERAVSYNNQAISQLMNNSNIAENVSRLCAIYDRLGIDYHMLGDFNKAIDSLSKAVELIVKYKGENHPDLIHTYSTLSAIYTENDDPKKGIDYGVKAVQIAEENFGKEDIDTAEALCNLGYAYMSGKEPTKAKESFERAKRIFEINKRTESDTYHRIITDLEEIEKIIKTYVNKAKK